MIGQEYKYGIDHVSAEDMRLYNLRGCGFTRGATEEGLVRGVYPPGLSDLSHYCASAQLL